MSLRGLSVRPVPPCGQTKDETTDQEPGIPQQQRPQPLFRAYVYFRARSVGQQQHLDGDATYEQHSAGTPPQGLDHPSCRTARPRPGEKPSQHTADKAQQSHAPQTHHHEPPGAFLGKRPRRDTEAPTAAHRPVKMEHGESDRPGARHASPQPQRCLVMRIFIHSEEHATAAARHHHRREKPARPPSSRPQRATEHIGLGRPARMTRYERAFSCTFLSSAVMTRGYEHGVIHVIRSRFQASGNRSSWVAGRPMNRAYA